MKTPQYLVVKYIGDLQRYEPKNVGVIVLSNAGVDAQFLNEDPAVPGVVRRKPAFIHSLSAYQQWVSYWRRLIRNTQRQGEGTEFSERSADLSQRLQDSSKGNYIIVNGGTLLDPVPPSQLLNLANHLFETLVGPIPKEPQDERTQTLDYKATFLARCRQRLEAELKPGVSLLPDYSVPCKIGDTVRGVQFDYATKNGYVQGLYDLLPAPRSSGKKKLEEYQQRVNTAALKFERVIEQQLVERGHTAILLDTLGGADANPEVEKANNFLKSVTNVWNVGDGHLLMEGPSSRLLTGYQKGR